MLSGEGPGLNKPQWKRRLLQWLCHLGAVQGHKTRRRACRHICGRNEPRSDSRRESVWSPVVAQALSIHLVGDSGVALRVSMAQRVRARCSNE